MKKLSCLDLSILH